MTQNNSRRPKKTKKSKVLRTDQPTDGSGCRVACTRLKKVANFGEILAHELFSFICYRALFYLTIIHIRSSPQVKFLFYRIPQKAHRVSSMLATHQQLLFHVTYQQFHVWNWRKQGERVEGEF